MYQKFDTTLGDLRQRARSFCAIFCQLKSEQCAGSRSKCSEAFPLISSWSVLPALHEVRGWRWINHFFTQVSTQTHIDIMFCGMDQSSARYEIRLCQAFQDRTKTRVLMNRIEDVFLFPADDVKTLHKRSEYFWLFWKESYQAWVYVKAQVVRVQFPASVITKCRYNERALVIVDEDSRVLSKEEHWSFNEDY